MLKISITEDGSAALSRMIATVNSDFMGGRISKGALLSWILTEFEKHHFVACVEEIRVAHFDKIAYLASALTNARLLLRQGAPRQEVESKINLPHPTAKPNQRRTRQRHTKVIQSE